MKIRHWNYLAFALASSQLAFVSNAVAGGSVPDCDYTKLVVNAPSTVNLVAQGKSSGSVEGTDKELGYLRYKCSSGKLVIDTKNNVRIRKGYEFNLTNGSVNEVILNGDQEANITEVTASEFDLSVYGSATSQVSGNAEYLSVTADGDADVDASELKAKKVKVRINGSGQVKVHASETLDAQANGSGRIEYSGVPKHLKASFNGSGSISSTQ
ncbi:hypothetical protein MADA3029_410055 [Vibrio nigripulchritudo MADA3029]|uniref:GIN domain-containing protein n=1 Tax=Vibrio nigripulchritudo TaxID=28173 RepID=UPI0003B23D3A|nr:DUF2807 domain-containing protein [Vibrio nigripulchritudo]CCN49650.1 hypothetical protein VIBNIMADA3020_770015 [Vibrio nigripulchritudo MADA3020]CCN52018.1 hypothetical protein VIBNIMADA3021_1200015 [Vibrio nigripulchritudo MADA3021]CCN59381.1 hypothetical protein MADA3029_410055 [Vibrio nigripulchritudo MADA3029]